MEEQDFLSCEECGALVFHGLSPRTGLTYRTMHEAWHKVLTETLQNLHNPFNRIGGL